jgi:hypothetical protein
MEVQGIRVCISPLACFDFERDFGGADEDRTRDLLTASFPLNIDIIVFIGLTRGTARHRAAKKRNFRTPDATIATPPGGVEGLGLLPNIWDPPSIGTTAIFFCYRRMFQKV